MSNHATRPTFDLMVNLPEPLLPTFNRVVTFTEAHFEGGTPADSSGKVEAGKFIWSDFRNAITNRPGSDMEFDRFQSTTFRTSQDSGAPQPEADIVAKVITYIADSFPAVSQEQLAEHVKVAFGESAEEFNRTPTSMRSNVEAEDGLNKVEWEYRFIYGYPNADPVNHLDALVATVKYQEEVIKKSGIFGLPIGETITHKYSADVVAMQTVVSKEFSGAFSPA